METNTANRLQQDVDDRRLRTAVANSCSKVEACVRDNPQLSMLLSLGMGLGVGLLAGLALAQPQNHAPHGWFDRRTAQRIGDRMLDNFGSWVPDAVTRQMSD